MKHSVSAVLSFLFAMGLSHAVSAQTGPCAGKAPGKYCTSNPQMIMTCNGTPAATAVSCGTAIGTDGKELTGRCVSAGPNDNKASCSMTPPGPCTGKPAGKYCVGEMIMTCSGTASVGTAVGCGTAMGQDGKALVGRCVSAGPNDNKATCTTAPKGPCEGKPAGKYCVGEMIMTCSGTGGAGTAVGCGTAMGQDGKALVGKCSSSGPNDGKATCVMK